MITTKGFLYHLRLACGALAGVLVLSTAVAQAADCVRPKSLSGTTPHVINFAEGSTAIPPDQQAWLKEEAERFQSHPSLEVCVIGQADKTGDSELNKKISMERAEAVAGVLKNNGLADKKFQVIGRGEAFGDTKDTFIGKLLEGESQTDRRVEVIFFK